MADEYRLVADADELSASSRAWAAAGLDGVPPDRWALMQARPDRAVRVHLLPESRQYPDDDGDRREILRRHRVLLEWLGGAEVVLAPRTDGDPPAPVSGRRWRTWRDVDADHDLLVDLIDPLPPADVLERWLLTVAEDGHDRADLLLAPADFAWTYLPYPGGVDVTARDADQLDALLDEFSAWLPLAERRDYERAAWRFVELLDRMDAHVRGAGEAGLAEGLSALMSDVRGGRDRSGRWHGIAYEQHGGGFRLRFDRGAVDVDLLRSADEARLHVDPWKVVAESRRSGRRMAPETMRAVLAEDVLSSGRLEALGGVLAWPGEGGGG